MKVVQLITDDRRRGAQVFASDLAPALTRLGASVTTQALASETDHGLDVEVLGPTRRHPRTWLAVRRSAKKSDVVIAHGSTTLTLAILASLGTGTPVVYRQISDSQFWAKDGLRRLRVRLLLARADRVVALAQQSKRVLIDHFAVPGERIDVVPNGVPTADMRPPSDSQRQHARATFDVESKFCVLSLGALVPEKGVDVAISAIADCAPWGILLVAGEGPERERLESLARDVGADVRFLGAVERPIEVLHAADALVLASKGGDSMPAVLIEAAMTGVPIIATPIGAIPEMVDNGRNGVLLDSADPDAVRDALSRLAHDETWRDEISAQALDDSKRYDIDAVAVGWLNACERAVATRLARG